MAEKLRRVHDQGEGESLQVEGAVGAGKEGAVCSLKLLPSCGCCHRRPLTTATAAIAAKVALALPAAEAAAIHANRCSALTLKPHGIPSFNGGANNTHHMRGPRKDICPVP
ncbi:hypothetical protein VF21_02681 [Pseudogymnoascus sp. 05NY08]|nr:hypothetical protein VF21_02681 [Pseudogymnoascus sp. 05NY08]